MRRAVAILIVAVGLGGCGPAAEPATSSAGETAQPLRWPEAGCDGRGQPRCAPIMATVSSGAPMINEEYGIAATFSSGSRVCPGLSGSHPHGFYSRLGDERAECFTSKDPPASSAIGIWADYNTAFHRTFSETGASCEAAAAKGIDVQPLVLRGLPSRACVERGTGGWVYITVMAFAGRWGPPSADPDSDAPYLIYTASLASRDGQLGTDLQVFRRFLDGLVLTPPAPQGG